MDLITIKDLDRWGACCRDADRRYSDAALAKLLDGRPGLTPLEVCDLDIPVEDRIWVLLRPDVLGKDGLRRVLDRIVARAIRRGQRALRGVRAEWATKWRRWARAWISGEDRSEAAAGDATRAARYAAWDATRAARYAAWDAAWAAWDAAWAARYAAWDAAGDERRLQLRDIRREIQTQTTALAATRRV